MVFHCVVNHGLLLLYGSFARKGALMLIYTVADIHGRRERLAAISTHIAEYKPDVLVLAGDISRRWRPRDVFEPLSRLSLPVLFVRGNSDTPKLEAMLNGDTNLHSLHFTRRTIDNIDFVGCGGTLPLPFHSRLGFKESEKKRRLSRLLTPGSVLVVHPPPYGIRDRVLGKFHAGSRAVKQLVEKFSPALVICGHIHEQSGVEMSGETVVVNCAVNRKCGGVLVRYDGQSVPKTTLLA
jgi:hypothetical protein